MIRLTPKEIKLVEKEDVSRVSTISSKGWPQTTPISHLFHKGYIYFATDYGTKKLENIKKNNKVSILVDVFARQPKGLTIQGYATIIEKGNEFVKIEKLFEKRYSYYKANPFKEGEAPIIKIEPVTKKSWGVN